MTDEQKPASPPSTGNQQVQLGIGTLIIIALIVTMCSGKGEMEKVRKDTAELKQQVSEINRKLDAMASKDSATDAPADTAPGPEGQP
jgi:outer membrane murein-binding lipoprotein Lpp